MRLNRVLLLAAVISMAMFAMVFTISCSGEDGSDGKAGTGSCNVQAAGSGYDVFCNGAKVGSLEEAAIGPQGPQGPQGPEGNGCNIEKTATGYNVFCNGALKGTLEGCKIQYDGITTISCVGSDLFAVCGAKLDAFNPEIATCEETTPGTFQVVGKTGNCVKDPTVEYNLKDEYCGYANEAAFKSGTVSAITLLTGVCKSIKPNAEAITAWKDEYCMVIQTKDPEEGTVTKNAELAEPITCGTATAKINELSWKGQYCGWTGLSAAAKTIQSDACDDGKGPNEDAAYFGYCQVPSPTAKATVYVEGADKYCGGKRASSASASGTVGKRVNGVACSNGSCNVALRTASEKYQYCGWTQSVEAAKVDPDTLIVTDAKGGNACAALAPNSGLDDAEQPATDADLQYCQANADGELSLTTFKESCQENPAAAAGSETYVALNEGTWQKQYCGWASTTATSKSAIAIADNCVSLLPAGPNSDGNAAPAATAFEYCSVSKDGTATKEKPGCTTAGAKLNENTYNGEYCAWSGPATSPTSAKSVATLTSDCQTLTGDLPNDATRLTTAPATADDFEYCVVDRQGSASLVKFSEAKCSGESTPLNVGEWKGEYCGWATSAAAGVLTDKTKQTALNALCKLSIDGLNTGTQQPATDKDMEYCQVNQLGKAEAKKPSDNPCGMKLNENSWAGEYCVTCIEKPRTGMPGSSYSTAVYQGTTSTGNVCYWGGTGYTAWSPAVTAHCENPVGTTVAAADQLTCEALTSAGAGAPVWVSAAAEVPFTLGANALTTMKITCRAGWVANTSRSMDNYEACVLP